MLVDTGHDEQDGVLPHSTGRAKRTSMRADVAAGPRALLDFLDCGAAAASYRARDGGLIRFAGPPARFRLPLAARALARATRGRTWR